MPGIDIQHLMRQARKLEKAMADARASLDQISVEAESGGGLVKVKMDGRCKLLKIEIDAKALEPFALAERRAEASPEQKLEPSGSAEGRAEASPQHQIDPSDKAMLEDLVAAAVNAGAEKARLAAEEHLKKSTGGIQVPGLPY